MVRWSVVVLFLIAGFTFAQAPRQAGMFSLHDDPATAFVLDGDVKHALLAFQSGGVVVFPTDQRTVELFAFRAHPKAVTAAAFIPGDPRFATASADGTVRLWKVEDARKHHKALRIRAARGSRRPRSRPGR